MSEAQPRGPWIDWQSVLLSTWMPFMAACAFLYLAISFADDDPPEALVFATLALIPLELIRSLVFGALSGSFKASKGRLDALYVFLVSILFLAALLIFFGASEYGIVATFKFLIDPDVWKLLWLPVLIMAVDGVINILTFRGDPGRQARLLETISNDSFAWLALMVTRLPIALALVYLALFWLKSDGYGFAAWLPAPDTKLLRTAGWSYAGCYFLGKAVLIAHVHTAHYARTGRGLLDVAWIHWLLRDRKRNDWRGDKRAVEEATTRTREKSVLVFQEDVIRPVQKKSQAHDKF